jgi:hypothetical protein
MIVLKEKSRVKKIANIANAIINILYAITCHNFYYVLGTEVSILCKLFPVSLSTIL